MNLQKLSNSNIYIETNTEKHLQNNKKLEEFKSTISRDIDRTFHFGRFLTDEGKRNLYDILCNLAKNNIDIGYCQGMNFVAASLLEFSNSVSLSTDLFQYMLDYMDVYYLYIEVYKQIIL